MRYQILAQLQKPNARVACDIDHPPPVGTGVELRGHVLGRVELTNTGRVVIARGHVSGQGVLECSRCLREFLWQFSIEFTENCALSQTDDPREYTVNRDEDEIIPILDDDIIDLTELIRQLIAVEVPFAPLCRPDCPGLCPKCGAVLDEESCNCQRNMSDPRWAKLRELLGE
ncbi:MAG: YceD family protein [Candidatus Zipacnadales bacterium]